MAISLKIPALGESISEATIGTWLKKEGDYVQADEPVVEVESEKATVAVPAPAVGVLKKILKQSDATVGIGESVGELEERLDIHQPNLSQQLTVLREAEVVDTRRDGKQIYYRLTARKAERLVGALYDIFCADGGTK